MATDYKKTMIEAIDRAMELTAQNKEMNEEIQKLIRFVQATLPLVSDEDRKELSDRAGKLYDQWNNQATSLTESIRKVLNANQGKWMTTAAIRTSLIDTGFDFSGYTSNPLASVSTTIKRLSEKDDEEIESIELEGVAAYRRKPTLEARTLVVRREQKKKK